MKVPFSWLKELVDIDVTAQELEEKLFSCGFEVEELIPLDAGISKVVVGKIVEMEKQEGTHLTKCVVDCGDYGHDIRISTGASNMKLGDCVPAALDGSTLPGGIKIKARKMQGVESNGMLCSGEELGLNDDLFPGSEVYGLLILPEDSVPGTDIAPVVGLDDLVAAVFQIAAQGVEHDQRAGVADVDIVVNGRAADVDAVLAGHLRHELFLLAGQGVENLHKNLSFCVADRSRKNKKALLAVPWYSNEGGSHSKSRFHFCLSLKAGNGGRRTAILSFPQCALRAHFPQSSANRLPANGPFSLCRRSLRYSARINAFVLIQIYYNSRRTGSQAI